MKPVLYTTDANSEKTQTQYFYNGKWWYIELLANSIATVVFPKI